MHLYLLLYWGTSWILLCYVFFMWNKQTSCKACYSWIFCLCLFMLHHSFFVLLLELCLSCYDWSTLIPALSVLQILWSSLWWCMSPKKLFFLFITYLLEDEQELSLGMLIHCKCIYNFWCSMLGFIHFLVFCPHFGVLFIWFLGLTYSQEPQCQLPVFCCFWF